MSKLGAFLIICINILWAENVIEKEFELNLVLKGISTNPSAKIVRNASVQGVLTFLVPEGSFVKKGQVIFRLSDETLKEQLEQQLVEKKALEKRVKLNALSEENELLELNNNLQELQDLLKIREAKLARELSFPLKEDLIISESKISLAKTKLKLLDDEKKRTEEMLKKELISRSRYNDFLSKYKRKEQELIFLEKSHELLKQGKKAWEIELTKLSIEGTKLKIEDALNKIESFKIKKKLEVKKSSIKIKSFEYLISFLKSQIKKCEIFAPEDGYLRYKKPYSIVVEKGARMYPRLPLADIVKVDDVAVEAYLPEAYRRFINNKDDCKLQIVGDDEIHDGIITSIDNIAIDQSQIEVKWGVQKSLTNLKFYKILFKFKNDVKIIPNKNIDIFFKQKQVIKKLACKMEFIRKENGNFFIYDGDAKKKVFGFQNGAYFYFDQQDKQNLQVKSWPNDEQNFSSNDEFFTGKIFSDNATYTVVKELHSRKNSIEWLIEEESMVKKGQLIAKIASVTSSKKLISLEEEKGTLKNDIANYKKQTEFLKKENINKEKVLRNDLAVKKIEKDNLNKISEKTILQLNNAIDNSKLVLADSQRKFKIANDNKKYYSQSYLNRLKRQVIKNELNLERNKLTLKKELMSHNRYRQNRFDRKYKEVKNKLQEFINNTKNNKRQNELKEKELSLKHVEEKIQNLKRLNANYKLFANSSGMVVYQQIANSSKSAVVKQGLEVEQGNRILQVADISSMYIEVDVPERYFSKLKEGMEVKVQIPAKGKSLNAKITSLNSSFFSRDIIKKGNLYSSNEPNSQSFFKIRVDLGDLTKYNIAPGLAARVYLSL